MPKKFAVKAFLSKEEKALLELLARKLGETESGILRIALLHYAENLNLLKQLMHKHKPD